MSIIQLSFVPDGPPTGVILPCPIADAVGNAIATSVEDSSAVLEGDEFTEGQSVMCANILCKQVFDFFVVVVIVYFWNGGSLYSCFICDLWLCMVSY